MFSSCDHLKCGVRDGFCVQGAEFGSDERGLFEWEHL